jgi:hypothetical protein
MAEDNNVADERLELLDQLADKQEEMRSNLASKQIALTPVEQAMFTFCMLVQCPPYWVGCLLCQLGRQGRYPSRCEENRLTFHARRRRASGDTTKDRCGKKIQNMQYMHFSNMQNMQNLRFNIQYAKHALPTCW